MELKIVDDGGEVGIMINGPLGVKIPKSVIKKAARVAMLARLCGDDDMMVQGFFDEIGKGLTFFKKKILDNPIVRGVVSVIPYGGAALAAADMVEAGVNLGSKALAQLPKGARSTLASAAKGHKGARAKIAKIQAMAKRGDKVAQRDAATLKLAAQLELAQKELLDFKALEARRNSPAALPQSIDTDGYSLPE